MIQSRMSVSVSARRCGDFSFVPTPLQIYGHYLTRLSCAGASPGLFELRTFLRDVKSVEKPAEAVGENFFARLMKEYPGQPNSGTAMTGNRLMRVERVG